MKNSCPLLGQEGRRVGREAAGRPHGPGVGRRVERLAVHGDLADVVETGHGHVHAVAQLGQRRVPAGVVHRVDLDELFLLDVVDVSVVRAEEVLLLQGHGRADAVQLGVGLRAEQALDLVLLAAVFQRPLALLDRVHPDVLLAGRHDGRAGGRVDLLGCLRNGEGEGRLELGSVRRGEDRTLGQLPGLRDVVVDNRHAAAGVGRVEVLVPGGASGKQDVAVGQLDVAGAEQVPGGGDQLSPAW